MPDILVLEIQPSINKELIYIINAYNTSIESKEAGKSIDILIKILKLIYKCILIMEDFHLHYTN